MKKYRFYTNISFFIFVLIAITVLLVIPTGFEPENIGDNIKVKAMVLEVDNSNVEQYGIVKAGVQALKIEILNTRFKGVKIDAINNLVGKMELDKFFKKGDKVFVVCNLDGNNIIYANVLDHYRINIEFLLLLTFIILLIFFAQFIGAKAVISFIFTIVVIWKVLLPFILKGYNPVIISIIITIIITFVIIFLVAGINRKGLVAFLGASTGIILTCILSLLFGKLFKIHGAVKPFAETLLYSGYPHLDLGKIFLSGIFIASSGAVMDLGMDISASMKELVSKHPSISFKELMFSGFNIGKAVVGTMTTTLLLAYTGGYTTMLMVFIAQKTPVLNILNINYVAAEVLHTLVGSFGLVCVAPFTAIVGAFLYANNYKSLFVFIENDKKSYKDKKDKKKK